MLLKLCPRAIFKALFLSIVGLTILNLAGVISTSLGHGSVYGLVQLFDFNLEQNIPTLYSSINLMFSAMLLTFVSLKHKATGQPWGLWSCLSAIFVFLSLDEFFQFHEHLAEPVQNLLHISDAFYYVWSLPYILFLGTLLLLYYKFLMRLPKKTRTLFVLAGILFVIGAVGLEMIGNLQAEAVQSKATLAHRMIVTGEEFLEMLGIVTFIYALFDYIVVMFGPLIVRITNETPRQYTQNSR